MELDFSDPQAVIGNIAKALGVENAKKKLNEAQIVTLVTDETDLDAAAKFDFLNWMKISDILEEVGDVPERLASQKLKKTFSVPKIKELTSMGVLTI